jgi:hypothetical protein
MIALIVPPFPAVSCPRTQHRRSRPRPSPTPASPPARRAAGVTRAHAAFSSFSLAVPPAPRPRLPYGPPRAPRRDAWSSWPPRLPSARPRLGTPSQRHVLLHAVTGAQPTTHVSIYLRVNPWPTRHLPVSASYGREPDFEGPPRLLSSVRSGYRLGRWDAAGRNIGRSVGAGPVPNTPLHRPGRTHARLAPHHYGAMPWRVGIGRRR